MRTFGKITEISGGKHFDETLLFSGNLLMEEFFLLSEKNNKFQFWVFLD